MEKKVQVRARLWLVREGKLMGPGVARLLEGVRRLGSLRRSAAEMQMSYSKAWSILRQCEAQAGFALTERRVGGAGGGGAQLTPQGEELLERYRAFEKEAQQTLDQLAQKYFAPQEPESGPKQAR